MAMAMSFPMRGYYMSNNEPTKKEKSFLEREHEQGLNAVENDVTDESSESDEKTVIKGQTKFKEFMSTPLIRGATVVGTIVIVGAITLAVSMQDGGSKESIDGRDGVTGVEVNTITKQGDHITEGQAQHLTEQQRLQAEQAAAEGKTNAVVITTYTADKQNQTATIYQQETVTTKVIAQEFLIDGKNMFDTSRYERRTFADTGETYFYDKQTKNQITLTTEKQVELRDLDLKTKGHSDVKVYGQNQPQNAIFNTQQQSGQNPNQAHNNNSGNGGNGGQQQQAQAGDASQEQPEFTEDADVASARARLATGYTTYHAQVTDIQNQYSVNQQTYMNHREQQLQQRMAYTNGSFSQAQNNVQQLMNRGQSFAPLQFGVPKSQNQQQQQNNQQPNPQYQNQQNNGSYQKINYNTSGNTQLTQSAANTPLPKGVIRAGTSFAVVVTKEVNTDYTTSVQGYIASGPFTGSTVHGYVVQQNRDIGVVFTAVQRPNPRLPLIAVNARAEGFTKGSNVSTDVNRHYVQNYTHAIITSAISGYGNAYSNLGESTTITRADGSTVTTNDGKTTEREIYGNIAQQLGTRLQQDIAHLGNRPPTFKIAVGTVLQMRIITDWDTNTTTNSISTM